MSSQHSLNMNAGLIPVLRPSREPSPVSFLNRRPPKNDKMFEIRPPDFLRCHMRRADFLSSSHRVETLKTLPFFFFFYLVT